MLKSVHLQSSMIAKSDNNIGSTCITTNEHGTVRYVLVVSLRSVKKIQGEYLYCIVGYFHRWKRPELKFVVLNFVAQCYLYVYVIT